MTITPRLSVIVATYRREDALCQTLTGLFDQGYPDYEIIVVDQTPAHAEPTRSFLEAHRDRFRYVVEDWPSLPNARNVGLRHATGEIAVFIDDDCLVAPGFLEGHAAAYRDPAVGGVAGQILTPGAAPSAAEPVGRIADRYRLIYNFHSTVVADVAFAQGCNMSFRREVALAAGGFEPGFAAHACFEEVDMCLRVRRLGWRIRFEPSASLLHLERVDGGCGNRRIDARWFYWWLHNRYLAALRHPTEFSLTAIARLEAERIVRELRDPALLPLWPSALAHALVSHRRCRGSLAGRRAAGRGVEAAPHHAPGVG